MLSGRFPLPMSSRGLTGTTELTGSTNLITHYNLEHAYNKFCGKKVKEKLSNFLPDLPGMIDLPGSHDSSSLRSLIEKPPICGSSFTPLTGAMLTGFRLHAGPVSPATGSLGGGRGPAWPGLTSPFSPQLPEQCRLMHIQPPKKKNKHKHKQSRTQDPVPPGKGCHHHPSSPSALADHWLIRHFCFSRNPLRLRPQEEKEEKRGGSGAKEEEEREEEKEGEWQGWGPVPSPCTPQGL